MTIASDSTERQTAPAVSAVPSIALPILEEQTLAGGAELKIYNGGDSDVCCITVVREGGKVDLSPAESALFANMMKEGSDNLTAEEIAEILDYNGAWMSTSISSYHHAWNFYLLNSKIDKVADAIENLVKCPKFDSANFEMHRESAAKRLEIAEEKVKYIAESQASKQGMGQNNPLAATATAEEIRSLRHEDFATKARQFSGNHTTIIAGGKITEAVRRRITAMFEDMHCKPSAYSPRHPFTPAPGRETVTKEVEDAVQAAVVITLPAPDRHHPDYVALHIAVGALGGYFGSRLMLNIREKKGYTYGINAGLLGYPDGAVIQISAECDNTHIDNLIAEVEKEMFNLADNPPQGTELERLRQAMSSSLLEVVDTPFAVTRFHTTMLTSGIPDDYFDSKVSLLHRITPDIIAEAAKKYLRTEDMKISIAKRVNRLE